MPRHKRRDRGWSSLPWQPVEVRPARSCLIEPNIESEASEQAENGLGELVDDGFCFTVEELDGDAYSMERDEVGGCRIVSRRGKRKVEGTKQEQYPTGEGEDVVIQEIEYENDGNKYVDDIPTPSEGSEGSIRKATGRKRRRKGTAQDAARPQETAFQTNILSENTAAAASNLNGTATSDFEERQQLQHSAEEPSLLSWSAIALGGICLHPLLLKNLQRQGFVNPTHIQRLVLPHIIERPGQHIGKDLMGAAETGSGKTLAYGLPILDYLLKERAVRQMNQTQPASAESTKSPLSALILCPTRELSLQVTQHLQAMLVGDIAQGRDRINVVSIVGGLSDRRQERLLARKPEVVIATVGRLWELITTNAPHVCDLGRLRFFVLDEADRMVEEGHYSELSRLFELVVDQAKAYQSEYDASRRRLRTAEGSDKAQRVIAKVKHQGKIQERKSMAAQRNKNESEENELKGPEVPTRSLQDVLRQARELGLTRKYGLEGQEERKAEDEVKRGDEGMSDIDYTEQDITQNRGPTEDGESKQHLQVHIDQEHEIPPPVRRQVLIFSATLHLPPVLRQSIDPIHRKKQKHAKYKSEDTLTAIMQQVGARGRPALVDLSRRTDWAQSENAVAPKEMPLTAASEPEVDKVSEPGQSAGHLALPAALELIYTKCTGEQKNAHLFCFLHHYLGRSLIFTNSIQQTKKVAQILTMLQLPARALHAKMQQRQRLKSLDQFRTLPRAILVATDVAARGLDIPLLRHPFRTTKQVDRVIHYDLPHTIEVFIHRSGRTARATRSGMSFLLVSPSQERAFEEIRRNFHATCPLSAFPVHMPELEACWERVRLAATLAEYQQEEAQRQAASRWVVKKAQDSELMMDEALRGHVEEEGVNEQQRVRQVEQDRKRLALLLSKPLLVQKQKCAQTVDRLERRKNSHARALQALMTSRGARQRI